MKEVKDKPENHESTLQIPKKKLYYSTSTWKLAKRQHISNVIKCQNTMTEVYFNMVVAEAKRLYAPLEQTAFERDYRECNDEYACSMHTFANGSIYLHLQCDLTMEYCVRYDFNDCPFEAEITAMIERLFVCGAKRERTGLLSSQFEFFAGEWPNDEEKEFLYVLKAD